MLTSLLGILLVACAGDESEARVRFVAIGWDAGTLQRDRLEFAFEDDAQSGAIRGDELVVDDTYAQPHSPWISTSTSGRLRVSVTIRQPDGAVIAHRMTELELKRDWAWEVQAHISDTDPAAMCFGCAGSLRVTPVDSEGDAVWLVWGGNSISEPVAY